MTLKLVNWSAAVAQRRLWANKPESAWRRVTLPNAPASQAPAASGFAIHKAQRTRHHSWGIMTTSKFLSSAREAGSRGKLAHFPARFRRLLGIAHFENARGRRRLDVARLAPEERGQARAYNWNAGDGLTSFTVRLGVVLLACLLVLPGVHAQTRPLNDTGITFSGNATSGNSASCLATDPLGQDCSYGRDAAARAGSLTKVGGSSLSATGVTNGFDFTKVCNSGQTAGSGTCPANPTTPGYGTDEWGCTKDNVTGLLWEVKTTTGLRSMSHSYTWYMTGSPDGNNGTASGGSCATAGRCDTEKFVADVNSAASNPTALCGYRDWRMPTVKELEGISDIGRFNPAIDPTYFPDTPGSSFWWSGSPSADPPPFSGMYSWGVDHPSGNATTVNRRAIPPKVRLVRSGQ